MIQQFSLWAMLRRQILVKLACCMISLSTAAQLTTGTVAAKQYTGAAINDTTPMPLRLVNFYGRSQKDIVVFKWSTAAEKNINHFELEKSTDGIQFTCINKQTAKGITSTGDTYEAEDFKPVNGINFYRLKFITNNARFSYSKIIKVKYK